MNAIRRVVVATLLAVWCFPAVSMANSAPRTPAPVTAESAPASSVTSPATPGAETGALAAREQQARQLQDFKGGQVYVYIGGSVLVVVLVVILVLLLV